MHAQCICMHIVVYTLEILIGAYRCHILLTESIQALWVSFEFCVVVESAGYRREHGKSTGSTTS